MKRLVPIKNIPGIYPGAFSVSSIRFLIFNEKTNGFSKCILRIGKKILIDLDLFEEWLVEQQSIPKSPDRYATSKIKLEKKKELKDIEDQIEIQSIMDAIDKRKALLKENE